MFTQYNYYSQMQLAHTTDIYHNLHVQRHLKTKVNRHWLILELNHITGPIVSAFRGTENKQLHHAMLGVL